MQLTVVKKPTESEFFMAEWSYLWMVQHHWCLVCLAPIGPWCTEIAHGMGNHYVVEC